MFNFGALQLHKIFFQKVESTKHYFGEFHSTCILRMHHSLSFLPIYLNVRELWFLRRELGRTALSKSFYSLWLLRLFFINFLIRAIDFFCVQNLIPIAYSLNTIWSPRYPSILSFCCVVSLSRLNLHDICSTSVCVLRYTTETPFSILVRDVVSVHIHIDVALFVVEKF